MTDSTPDSLAERLSAGPVLVAEGYLFELERRGCLQAGAFVPEVVLDRPEAVRELHTEFVLAGSDVVEAFTYYAHREKLNVIGRGDILEALNLQALSIAGEVARAHGALLAGNICNTNVYEADDPATHRTVNGMFTEQVQWAVDAGADYIIAETLDWYGEAELALRVIKEARLPAVVTLSAHRKRETFDGVDLVESCRRLADAGADVVGLNCHRGPATLMPLIKEIRAAVECPVAALPVPYRTHVMEPTFQSLTDPGCDCLPGGRPFPVALDPFTCNRYECAEFARECRDLDVRYIGLCCGAAPHHIRAMAEALGRRPEASRYSPDMSRHAFYGEHESIPGRYRARRRDI